MNKIEVAFNKVPREYFLPKDVIKFADLDAPIQIGYGQTNSQPYTVKKMLEWLDACIGDKILDIGSGSGWTTALLSKIVGSKGKIIATELIPDLVHFGKDNIKKCGVKNATIHQANKNIIGWPKNAPYDKILVSASAEKLPTELIKQLKTGGRLVIPIKNSIWVIDKISENQLKKKEHPGFVFVPLK